MNDKNKISMSEIGAAFRAAGGDADPLGRVMESCGLNSKRELAETLSDLLHVPFVEFPEEFRIQRAFAELVPREIAERYVLIPYEYFGEGALTVVLANPMDLDAIDTVQSLTRLEVHKAVGDEEEIRRVIQTSYQEGAYIEENLQDIVDLDQTELDEAEYPDAAGTEMDQLKDQANEAPVIRFLNLILMEAVKDRASDIHFEPAENHVTIRFRIDGALREVTPPSKSFYAAIAVRIKILSELDISEHRLPQDGRFRFKVYERVIDVRVSVLPVAYGEKIVLRILDRATLLSNMADVGFRPNMLQDFQRVLQEPNGIVLLTGPTGSGKTTTLYGALNYLRSPELNIQTVEDPIEYLIDGINQTRIMPQIGLDFAACLRSILRQDPDIIMIGEMRDLETAQIAIRSSLTGHLVLSTLHTNDAPSSFSRLRDIGIESYLISATLKLVIAQRLVRKLCGHCKSEGEPLPGQMELLLRECPDASEWNFFRPEGCVECRHTGFRGRTGIFEFLEVNDPVRELISSGADMVTMRRKVLEMGMESLAHSGFMKVKDGVTTIDEVLHVAQQV